MEFASSYSNLPQQEDNFEPVKNFEQNYIIEKEKEPKNNSEVKLTEDQIKTIKEALLQYNMENKPIVKEEKNLTEINDMPNIKYDNWENNEPTKAEPTTKEEDKTKEPHSGDIPVISINQTLGNNKSNSVIENEKEFIPLTDYEKQEKHEEEEYNLDSFIPDKESYNLPSEPEEKSHEEENEEYNLDNLIETVEPNNEKEKAKLNDESGLDALIERVSPTNNDQEEYDLDNLIDNSKTDNIEDNTFASVVSVDSLPDEIKNNNPRERGKGVLKTVLEQLGISYENTKPKRRSL